VQVDEPQTIRTERLLLEPLVPAHALALTRFARLWEVARYTANIPHPYPAGCAEAFTKQSVDQRRDGGGWVFAVVPQDDPGVLGVVDITLSDDRRSGELGYAFAPWAWGQGYATEAARALVNFGFSYLRLDLIEAFAMVENPASCRVLSKAGLRRVGEQILPAPARGRHILCEAYRVFWTESLQ
tara:strand:+ start:524 stop:1075 length:552 start_codon:yes stop_codon:yes gene_type:complete